MFIRPLAEEDHATWLVLWQAYCAFHRQSLPSDVDDELWRRLHDPEKQMYGFAAENESGEVIGFTHYILHPYTWGNKPVCYLEDLFVREDCRGTGAGRALIDAVIHLAKASDWARVYWMTEEDNLTARRLYDKYVKSDGYVRYLIKL